MNMEMLGYLVGVIMGTLALILFGWLFVDSFLKWLEPYRRADKLLRAVLTRAQYRQLMWRGYVDIKSPCDQKRVYRVPRDPGLVGMIEQGKRKADLCLQLLEWVPGADIVVMHKLMIEADEETYLQTANHFTPKCNSDW
jgi:hypothetical protein